MQDNKLIRLLNDYKNSFSKDLAKIKVIPLIEDDISRILDIDDDLIRKIFEGNALKIRDFRGLKLIVKGIFEANINFEITSQDKNLMHEFISIAKSYIEENIYEKETLEYATRLLEILKSDNLTLDIYTDIDMEALYHIMAYQKLTPAEINGILTEILSTIEEFQEKLPDIELDLDNESENNPKRELTKEEATIIRDYAAQFSHITSLKEEENIELFNSLQNSQNIMEKTSIREKIVKGNLRLALGIFIDDFLKYYPQIDLKEILGGFGLAVVEAINKYNPEERTLEKLLKNEIKAFVKNEAKKLDTPLSMEESAQQLGTIISKEEEPNLDNEYLRDIYNAIDVEQLKEDSALTDDFELPILEDSEIEFYLDKLGSIDSKIMKLRLGIGCLAMSQQQVADILNKPRPDGTRLSMTQSDVSKREREAKERLKEILEKTRSFRK